VAFFSASSLNIGSINILDLRTHKVSVVPGSTGLFSPHWSPDGRYIAALSYDGQTLMLFDFKTKKWVELARITAFSRIGRETGSTFTFTPSAVTLPFIAGGSATTSWRSLPV
jgi:WD40 repeat protein